MIYVYSIWTIKFNDFQRFKARLLETDIDKLCFIKWQYTLCSSNLANIEESNISRIIVSMSGVYIASRVGTVSLNLFLPLDGTFLGLLVIVEVHFADNLNLVLSFILLIEFRIITLANRVVDFCEYSASR